MAFSLKRFLWLLFLPIICNFSSCEKEEFTPTGSNLLICKIEGEAFKPKSNDWKKPYINSSIKNDTLTVSGLNDIEGYHSIGFRIENFSGKGTYILNTREDNYGRYTFGSLNTFTNTNHTGEVVVTHYLPEKKIVAGTFHFTTVDPSTGKTYNITDGKFDIAYQTQ